MASKSCSKKKKKKRTKTKVGKNSLILNREVERQVLNTRTGDE